MRLEVQVESTVGELRSLQGWLRADPEVRRSAAVEVRGGVPGPGEMGTALDVLQLVTGNGERVECGVVRAGGGGVAADAAAAAAGGDPPWGHGHRPHGLFR